jgi:hypothetical protein
MIHPKFEYNNHGILTRDEDGKILIKAEISENIHNSIMEIMEHRHLFELIAHRPTLSLLEPDFVKSASYDKNGIIIKYRGKSIEEYFPDYNEEKVYQIIKSDKKIPVGGALVQRMNSVLYLHSQNSFERRVADNFAKRTYVRNVLIAEEDLITGNNWEIFTGK